jgi:hypothetical protein
MTGQAPQEGELILYRTANNAVRVEVLMNPRRSGSTSGAWPSCSRVDVHTVSEHLRIHQT